MYVVRRVALASSTLLLLVACSKNEQAAKDTAAAAAATPTPAPATAPALNLADAAGKWAFVASPIDGKDTSSTKYTVTATADTNGWMMEFPSGVKVPMQISVSGDSLLIKTGTFSSQRRKNVKVHTDGSVRLQGGKMVGMTTAHYEGAGADSVLHLRTEGTKMP